MQKLTKAIIINIIVLNCVILYSALALLGVGYLVALLGIV